MEGIKISNRNYPALDMLYKGSLGLMPIFEKDNVFFDSHNIKVFTKNWKFYINSFKQEINVVSNAFQEASIKAKEKLLALYRDFVEKDTSDFDIKGCYIVGDFVHMVDYQTKKGSQDWELAHFIFTKKGMPISVFIQSEKSEIYQNGWVSSLFGIDNNADIEKWLYGRFFEVVILKLFKSYADIETKTIFPNSKVKDFHCKYVNDTRLKLTYLDSKWFTNLVKSEGFSVRGHFRLQPKKKNGEWTKELIWINDFEKTGYTAPARMIKNAEQL
jgi:hypothetical protein